MRLGPPQAYVENPRLNTAIKRALLPNREPEGVVILHAPPHAGKTTAVTRVLHELFVSGKINVLSLGAGQVFSDFIKMHGDKHLNLLRWLEHSLGYGKKFTSHDLADIFPYDRNQPLSVLLIDQFETVFTEAGIAEIRSMMRNLAIDVANHKNYVAFVLIADMDLYKEMLTWNGGKKFQSVIREGFLWTPDELQAVVDTYQQRGFISPTATADSMNALRSSLRNMTTISSLRDYVDDHNLVKSFPVRPEL